MSGPKINFNRLRPMERSLSPAKAPGHRGDDRDLVLRMNLRPQPRTEPHVLVVQVHVDELTELTALVEEAVFEARETRVEGLDCCGKVACLDLHRGLAV